MQPSPGPRSSDFFLPRRSVDDGSTGKTGGGRDGGERRPRASATRSQGGRTRRLTRRCNRPQHPELPDPRPASQARSDGSGARNERPPRQRRTHRRAASPRRAYGDVVRGRRRAPRVRAMVVDHATLDHVSRHRSIEGSAHRRGKGERCSLGHTFDDAVASTTFGYRVQVATTFVESLAQIRTVPLRSWAQKSCGPRTGRWTCFPLVVRFVEPYAST